MNKQVLYVGGLPEFGKTTTTKQLSVDLNAVSISLDDIFNNDVFPLIEDPTPFIYSDSPTNPEIGKHFSISRFIRSTHFDIEEFIHILDKHIKILLNTYFVGLVVVDGYLGDFVTDFESIMNQLCYDVTKIIFEKKYIATINCTEFDLNDYNYSSLSPYLSCFYKDFARKNLVNATNYQKFDKSGSSDSGSKLLLSGLHNLIKVDDKVLDVGCNSGFFTFEVSELTSNTVIGLDLSSHSIEQANLLNRWVFKRTNCHFYCLNILKNDGFTLLSHGLELRGFNVIICFSTFHYFRESQKDFLIHMKNLLEPDGLLLLEVELSPSKVDEVEVISRKMDLLPCHFPSLKRFENMIQDLFSIQHITQSVFQNGSLFERSFILLKLL
jgi:SAM-dependent methyltransferase